MKKPINKREFIVEIILVATVLLIICFTVIPYMRWYYSDNKVLCEDCQYLQKIDIDNLQTYTKIGNEYSVSCDICGKDLYFSIENGKVVDKNATHKD